MSNTPDAPDMDATPQFGGSYLRQPDGTLVRAAPEQVVSSPVVRAELTTTALTTTSDKKE